jgi:hypothetical protein
MGECVSLLVAMTMSACGGAHRGDSMQVAQAVQLPAKPASSPTTPAPTTPAPTTTPVPDPAASAPASQPAAQPDPTLSGPTIDKSRIPAATTLADRGGWDGKQPMLHADARVMPANVTDPSQVPGAPTDIGAFREPCEFSHMAFDDPIVYPGQPGRSHLHVFFGNADASASTTAASLANSGASTCAGGTLNRSAYWVPAMIDTRTGTPIKPIASIFYYKTGYNGIAPASVRPLPQGLRMVAGSAKNAVPSGPFRYGCVNGPDQGWYGQAIPNCSVGSDLLMEVAFPQCWDGVNLDSPDHISHMANPESGKCPASHPVPVPEIRFEIHYAITAADAPSRWRLASDAYDPALPGGYSGHGDWFSGWDQAIMDTMVANCEQLARDCHAYLLGDGRTLY